MKNKYLIGLHDASQAFIVASTIQFKGYEVHKGESWDELIALSKNGFTDGILDANYGKENSTDVTRAEQFRSHFRGRLVVVSTNPLTVEAAKAKDLDAREKMGFFDQMDAFLEEKDIVMALHDPSQLKTTSELMRNRGFGVYAPENFEALKELARNPQYRNYVIDPNYGAQGSRDITPALEIRNILSARFDNELVRLLALSGHPDTVNSCIAQNIPCKMKPISVEELCAYFIKK